VTAISDQPVAWFLQKNYMSTDLSSESPNVKLCHSWLKPRTVARWFGKTISRSDQSLNSDPDLTDLSASES